MLACPSAGEAAMVVVVDWKPVDVVQACVEPFEIVACAAKHKSMKEDFAARPDEVIG